MDSSERSSSDPIVAEQEVTDICRRILEIFFEYALNKIDHSNAGFERGAQNFVPVVRRFVAAGERVEACLPAFPFKSANKAYKVLGKLPDKAEELALDRLNSICRRIQDIYPPGARITIISDGITYNDLLSISDQDTWAYGEALRTLATEKKFDCINFSRMKDLLDFPLPKEINEITYVANCTNFRRVLLNRYGDPDLDIDDEIATNLDTKLTYLGYKRFLESDLKYIFPRGAGRSSNSYKRDCKYIAKQMLIRGYAFAKAVKNAYPGYLRLSIHESIGAVAKISISLLNTKTGFTTPWHCSVAHLADGEWISAPMGEFSKNPRLELVHTNGVPSYFKEIPDATSGGLCISASFAKASAITTKEYFDSTSGSSSGVATPSSRLTVSDPRADDVPTPRTPPCPSARSISPKQIAKKNNASFPVLSENDAWGKPYGRRLIPQIMDSLAAADPSRTVYSLAMLSKNSLTYRHITARAFAQAVDKTAWWLQSQAGKPDSIQPVGYIGPHDLRHILLTYACVKAGYAVLNMSPKNSTEGTLAVLEATKCNVWVSAGDAAPIPLVNDVLQKRPMKALQLASLDDLLNAVSVEPFPYTKTFEEAVNEPFCFLHTSGTTGIPKPIPWSHGLIGTMDAVRLLPPVDGDGGLPPWTADWKAGDTIYSAFPMSHGAGTIMDILMPVLYELPCVLGPINTIPNVDFIGNLAESIKIDIWSMVPSLVDELGETPEVLAKFKSSKFICASGGPASPVSAGKANEVIRVLNLTGTTEGLFIGNLVPPREDWYWFCFHPSSGFEFKQLDEDTYEHWAHKNDQWQLFQGIFHTFQDKESINFKDLYMRHPTKPNLWAFKGRSDDLVVLSNGYKISPLEMEAYITTHPAVEGCLIFGTGKPQAGLLIELKDPSNKSEELMESIWKTVQEANSKSRHKNQLLRSFITFATPDKPFFRTDKRTIKRPATLALYANFIERFYNLQNDDNEDGSSSVIVLNTSSIESLQKFVLKVIQPTCHGAEGTVDPDTDFFQLGMDSLGVMSAVKEIRAVTKLDDLYPRHIYSNPTITKLSAALARMLAKTTKPAQESEAIDITPVTNSAGAAEGSKTTKLNRAITRHKAQQSFRLNPIDYIHGKVFFGLVFYIPLQEGASFQETFENLQAGLNRTLELIPALAGKVIECSEDEVGYVKGERNLSIPPPSKAASFRNLLRYKDLSGVVSSFAELRESGFLPSKVRDHLLIEIEPYFQFPAAVFAAQANFVDGGCLLTTEFNHTCFDGVGSFTALRVWAECCRYLQGDESATCDWFHPESFNHSLPEILHEQEGWAKPLEEVDPGTWAWVPFSPPDNYIEKSKTAPESIRKNWHLPLRPEIPRHPAMPAQRPSHSLVPTVFRISKEQLALLKEHVQADPETQGSVPSIIDIVQALLWRTILRARYRVATEIQKKTFGPNDISILELSTDGRPYFSEMLPETYMGTTVLYKRPSIALETLCAPGTTIGRVARLLREYGSLVSPQLVHDVFTLCQNLGDYTQGRLASVGREHMNLAITNIMMFQTDDLKFGERFFANGGAPEVMRLALDRHGDKIRAIAVLPITKDGAVEFVVGTIPEELDMLLTDEEFTRYACLWDISN
ncbi:transferase family protein [Xylaria bambusicola]|uniref:transferase family protein n=1 Tax=Xylaria bambusicola TaxID=326684 RepID=UPI002007466F|nr:transferase family protein [Xylaria bambusicola]KAI0520766.1 transferase family protein [Xylaria bambusicola]